MRRGICTNERVIDAMGGVYEGQGFFGMDAGGGCDGAFGGYGEVVIGTALVRWRRGDS